MLRRSAPRQWHQHNMRVTAERHGCRPTHLFQCVKNDDWGWYLFFLSAFLAMYTYYTFCVLSAEEEIHWKEQHRVTCFYFRNKFQKTKWCRVWTALLACTVFNSSVLFEYKNTLKHCLKRKQNTVKSSGNVDFSTSFMWFVFNLNQSHPTKV